MVLLCLHQWRHVAWRARTAAETEAATAALTNAHQAEMDDLRGKFTNAAAEAGRERRMAQSLKEALTRLEAQVAEGATKVVLAPSPFACYGVVHHVEQHRRTDCRICACGCARAYACACVLCAYVCACYTPTHAHVYSHTFSHQRAHTWSFLLYLGTLRSYTWLLCGVEHVSSSRPLLTHRDALLAQCHTKTDPCARV